jgi:hypothetical protein
VSYGDNTDSGDSWLQLRAFTCHITAIFIYSRTPLNPYLSVDTPDYGLWGVMG